MGLLVNKVADVLARKGWDNKTFVAYCMLGGIGQDTAYRLTRGDTNFNTNTLAQIAQIINVASISELIDLDHPQEQQ